MLASTLTQPGEENDEGQDVVEQDAGELAGKVDGRADFVVTPALATLPTQTLKYSDKHGLVRLYDEKTHRRLHPIVS